MAWVNEGTDVRRAFIGGSWGMRGYRLNEIKGRRYVMLNQEIRFPFAQSLALRTGSFAIGFAPILGALFVDLGNAWTRDYPGLLGSAGFGLRGLFMGGLVIRMDTGRKFNFQNDERPGFIRFFFGWDF
jgi:hemolysin activation/secretion protein